MKEGIRNDINATMNSSVIKGQSLLAATDSNTSANMTTENIQLHEEVGALIIDIGNKIVIRSTKLYSVFEIDDSFGSSEKRAFESTNPVLDRLDPQVSDEIMSNVHSSSDLTEKHGLTRSNDMTSNDTHVGLESPLSYVTHHPHPVPIKIVCLRMKGGYFDEDDETEEDLVQEQLGVLCSYNEDDLLTKVRAELYRQLEADKVPIKFNFLKSRQYSDSQDKNPILWVASIPYHKESTLKLSQCLTPDGSTLMLTSPLSVTKTEKINEEATTVEEVKKLWERERNALLMEIRQLEAKLAEYRNQDDAISPDSTLLKRSLIRLKNEGFVEKNLDELEKNYLEVFSQYDADTVFNSNETNPLRFVWRRLAQEPKKMREYLEALQSVLLRYRIRKGRLTSKFWARTLRDMKFVNDPSYFKTWSESQPWNIDDAERSAYLGSLVLSDTMDVEEYMILLDPIPGTGPVHARRDSISSVTSADSSAHSSINSAIKVAASRMHERALRRLSSRQDMKIERQTDNPKSVPSSTGISVSSSTSIESSNSLNPRTPSFQRVRIASDRPCDNFEVDVLAAQFGICVCGFPRWDHKNVKRAVGERGPSVSIPPPKAQMQVKSRRESSADIPCSSFQLDVDAARFGTCTCGFTKSEHNNHKKEIRGGHITELRPSAARDSLPVTQCTEFNPADDSSDICVCGLSKGAHEERKLEDNRARLRTTERKRLHAEKPCNDYQIDVDAARYGVCLCGHSKYDHGSHHFAADDFVRESTRKRSTDDNDRIKTSKERAESAIRWVEGEISRLITRIEAAGTKNEDGNYEITFGELFARYANISATLLGILIRTKRRKILHYDGGMGDLLLQGRHDDVVITLYADQVDKWNRARGQQPC